MSQPLFVVRSDNSQQPYMRGMLAHKLMQRGLPFDQAYQIAKDAKAHFCEVPTVRADLLMKTVDELIEARYGKESLANLAPEFFPVGKQIQVYRRNSSAPFSKGLLSQSVTACGIKPEEAYKVAFDVEEELRRMEWLRISKKDLFDRVYFRIQTNYNQNVADLYKLASRMDELDRPVIIYLGGASGSGKSVMSTFLAGRLGINKITGTDTIREIMRLVFSHELLPALHRSSSDAGLDMPSILDRKAQLKAGFSLQSQQVSVGVKAVVERAIKERTSMIIEGIHLLPYMQEVKKEGTVRAYHIPITLSLMNEKQHRNRFFERGKGNDLRAEEQYLRSFDNIRTIHEYCISESEDNDIAVVDNEDFDETTNTLMQVIINTLQEQVHSAQQQTSSG